MKFFELFEALEDEYAISRDKQWRGLKGAMKQMAPEDKKNISKEIEKEYGVAPTIPNFKKKKIAPRKIERKIVNGIDLGEF